MPRDTQWTACTAQKESGRFCDAPTIPGAPFPICLRHAAQLYAFLRDRVLAVAGDRETSLDAITDLVATRQVTARQPTSLNDGVVYYVQVGDMVKIGTTVNLRDRLRSYPPNRRLLASEPGGVELERQRHEQFRAACICGEWFELTADLAAHLEALNGKVSRPAA